MFPTRPVSLVLAAAIVGGGVALWELRRVPSTGHPTVAAIVPEPMQPVDAPADWCASGYEPIAGGCLALSESNQTPQPLLVYLHGRYARDAATDEVDRQRRLGAAATARGFAVLAVRGRLGECTAAELSQWFCWPSNEHNAAGAGAVVSTWAGVLAEAHRRARSKTRYVLGFSNGGYFAGLIATHALLDADAFVIAHGGPVEPVHATRGMPPLLLLSADDDVAQDDMLHLDEELTREHWVHDSYARGGAHGLTDQDIDAALTFFTRAHETLPLDPPLALHRPARHTHEMDKPVADQPVADQPVVDQPVDETDTTPDEEPRL
jgi:predicted esterase